MFLTQTKNIIDRIAADLKKVKLPHHLKVQKQEGLPLARSVSHPDLKRKKVS